MPTLRPDKFSRGLFHSGHMQDFIEKVLIMFFMVHSKKSLQILGVFFLIKKIKENTLCL